ncbi:MAG: DNA-binding response regulator, partial [Aliarcobacter sp.]|nr:DNA-binding response regulator [Aliarcobacter sp.]
VCLIQCIIAKAYLLEAVELRMEKYIVKPIELEMLFEVFEKCLETLAFNRKIILEIDDNYT